MIHIKSKHQRQLMAKTGSLLNSLFLHMIEYVKAGMSTGHVDQYAEECMKRLGLKSKAKGYKTYKHATCICLNEEVVHGVPSYDRMIKQGDLITLDICASHNNWCADMARTWVVDAAPTAEQQHLIDAGWRSLNAGIAAMRDGNKLGDISCAIERELKKAQCGIVREFAGHGIGKDMHEDPDVLNYGKAGSGMTLRPGLALAVEPMITAGEEDIVILSDGWTAITADKSLSLHVEDTVIVTEEGPWIITDPERKV